MIEIWKKYLVSAVAVLMAWGYGINASAGEATHVVAELQESIMIMMKEGRDLGYTGRYEIISTTIKKRTTSIISPGLSSEDIGRDSMQTRNLPLSRRSET